MQCPGGEDESSGPEWPGATPAGRPLTCLACGQPHPAEHRFCSGCGARLQAGPAGSDPAAGPGARLATGDPHPEPEGERRQLTVLFCDIVGSTALSERLDPEEYSGVIRHYHEECAGVVVRAGGSIAQYLGDGVLALFGFPHAHEDDAQRAVRAGLDLVHGMPSAAARAPGGAPAALSLRVGIHTGLVVVGEVDVAGRHELSALGRTPNIAARLQDLARPNTVLISGDTWRLVRRFFECRDLGALPVRGASSPVRVHEVLSERPAHGRLDALRASEITPLVGREEELALLLDRWRQARTDGGRAVLVTGEPGIGKSRLIQALTHVAAPDPHLVWGAWCSPYHQESALHPVADLLRRIAGVDREPPGTARTALVRQMLTRCGLDSPESLAIWSSLLALEPQAAERPPPEESHRWKQQTLEAILGVLLALSRDTPALFVVEDVQWADPSTLEFLDLLLTRISAVRLLVLLVYRPEFRPSFAGHPLVTQLSLNRFSRRQTEAMITHTAAGRLLPPEVTDQIALKTDGVPLFIEELTRMVLESGLLELRQGRYELAAPLPALQIPSTLHDSLMARLDRLGPARDVAQLCAVIGRSFPYPLLRAVAEIDDRVLQPQLARLVDSGLLVQDGAPPAARYVFRHALIRDAAYQSLLTARRRRHHQRVAGVLREAFPEIATSQPELVAHHYAEADFGEEAMSLYRRAGEHALARGASVEASLHLRRALDLLAGLPPSARRDEAELALQARLGAALTATRGYAAPGVERAYRRAQELCHHLRGAAELAPVLRGLAAFHYVRAQLDEARELARQSLDAAYRHNDVALRIGAHLELGSALFNMGAFRKAHDHFEQGIGLHERAACPPPAYQYGQDLGVSCLARAGITLAVLGDVDRAVRRTSDALALSEAVSHPPSTAYALAFAAAVRRLGGAPRDTLALAERTIHLAGEHALPFWASLGALLRGWALTQVEETGRGIACLEEALRSWEAMGAQISTPYFLGEIAEAYGRAGRAGEGLALLDRALALARTTTDCWYDAALHRIRGELLQAGTARPGGPAQAPEVEACFQRALEVARRQHAGLFALSAGLRLAELLIDRGRRGQAREVLVQAHESARGARDTAEARRLVSTLASIESEGSTRSAGPPGPGGAR